MIHTAKSIVTVTVTFMSHTVNVTEQFTNVFVGKEVAS